jgi:arylsulfatase A-like enzyme
MFRDYCPIPSQKRTLAEILKQSGYINFAINSNVFLSKYFGFNRGFDEYIEARPSQSLSGQNLFVKLSNGMMSLIPKSRKRGVFSGWERFLRLFTGPDNSRSLLENQVKITATELVQKAMHLWKHSTQPRFGWLHFMDCHSPYNPPPEFIERGGSRVTPAHLARLQAYQHALNRFCEHQPYGKRPAAIEELLYLYRASLAYVDAEIGKFVEFISNNGGLDNTIIVITSDHGELFMEHGFVEHPARMYDELLHVPWILLLPPAIRERVGTPASIETDVELLHLSPTVLDLLGIDPPASFWGRSLLPVLNGGGGQSYYPLISQTYKKPDNEKTVDPHGAERLIAVQDSRWKFILDTGNVHDSMLFVRKPTLNERTNLAADYPDVVDYFTIHSNAILDGHYEPFTAVTENYKILDAIWKTRYRY